MRPGDEYFLFPSIRTVSALPNHLRQVGATVATPSEAFIGVS
jgi:hypothetical protein